MTVLSRLLSACSCLSNSVCWAGQIYIGGFFHYLCQAFPPAVCAVGRSLEARSGTTAASAAGRELQREGSSAHALGCSIADNIHDGSLMIPTYFLTVGAMQVIICPSRSNAAVLRCRDLSDVIDAFNFWNSSHGTQGDSLDASAANLRREWFPSYLAGCGFWIPVMWLNFKIVPAPYRVRVMAVR
jgi:hypothetical protein